jgi:hypothetical protein
VSAAGGRIDDGRHDARWVAPVRVGAATVGAVFLIVGVAGFVPGVTQDASDIEFAGHDSPSELLGLFQVSVLHNVVHIAFGLAGLAAYRRASWARSYLVGGGLIYLVLLLYGLAIDLDSDANFVPLNSADNWLHLALGVGMIALGLLLPTRHDARHEVGATTTSGRSMRDTSMR